MIYASLKTNKEANQSPKLKAPTLKPQNPNPV